MNLVIRQTGIVQSRRRTRVQGLTDHPLRIPQAGKLVSTELHQDITALSLDILGPSGTLFVADENAPMEGQWPLAYMNSYGMTIAAGTSEVIRNILGERVLGMPKSR